MKPGIDLYAQMLEHTAQLAKSAPAKVGLTFRDPVSGLWSPTVYNADDPDYYPFGQLHGLDSIRESLTLDVILVTPEGLVLEALDIPWIWAVVHRPDSYPEYRIGSANDMVEFSHASKTPATQIVAVPADMIHGTCVFEYGERFDKFPGIEGCKGPLSPYAWGLVQAEGYKVLV